MSEDAELLDIFQLARMIREDIHAVRHWYRSMPWKLPPPVSREQRPVKWDPQTVQSWLANRQAWEDWGREAHKMAQAVGELDRHKHLH